MITINIPGLGEIRYKIREFWWRLENWYHCYTDRHITYDPVSKYRQVITDDGTRSHLLVSRSRRLIMNCRRCGKRVNVGLHDEYFSGDKKFEHA